MAFLPAVTTEGLLPVEEEKVGGIESASVPLDKIEATINMNAKPVPTLTDAISVTQSEVNLIKSLPQEPQQSTGSQLVPEVTVTNVAQQQFNMTYATPIQSQTEPNIYQSAALPPVVNNEQLALPPQPNPSQPSVPASQTTPPLDQSHTIQTLTPLQPHSSLTSLPNDSNLSQQSSPAALTPESVAPTQPLVTSALVNVPEGQLPPPPAPPSATSIGVFETEMVTQSQMASVLPPPPPLQPVQSVNQIPEMNTLTNLMPVVEPTEPSMRPPMSVVIKSEPQSYSESDSSPNASLGLKVNDDNNNPIHRSVREKEPVIAPQIHQPLVSQMRSFPLCVISTTPTPYVSKNKSTIVAPKYELTLPPKKAKYASTAGLAAPQTANAVKTVSSAHAVPSTGMLYDLPHNASDHSSSNSSLRVQSGLTPPLKLPHSRPHFCPITSCQ